MVNQLCEHELHSTRQGLSNKTTSHGGKLVLKVFSQSLVCKSRQVMFLHIWENIWSHNCLSRARIIILSTPSVLVDHLTYSALPKLLKSSN